MPNQKLDLEKPSQPKTIWEYYGLSFQITSFLIDLSNSYHRADYNLYWMNMQENLKQRLSAVNMLLHNIY